MSLPLDAFLLLRARFGAELEPPLGVMAGLLEEEPVSLAVPSGELDISEMLDGGGLERTSGEPILADAAEADAFPDDDMRLSSAAELA